MGRLSGMIETLWLALALVLSAMAMGCTSYDPRTEQQEFDAGATAGLVGLILGATALAVAADQDDDCYDRHACNRYRHDEYRYRHHHRDDYPHHREDWR